MLRWSDDGFIIDKKIYGENDLIVQIFTKNFGKFAGLIKAGQSKKYANIIQIGNLVNAQWKARLEQHLGIFKIEPNILYANKFITNKIQLTSIITIALYLKELPERENNLQIFNEFQKLLENTESEHNQNQWLVQFIRFELLFLAKSGFGIQINKCALTNSTKNINYVSPKSARAVCDKIAEPYKNKLLPIPQFLKKQKEVPNDKDIINGLNLTGFFIQKFIFQQERKIPNIRQMLAKEILKKNSACGQ